MTEPTMRVRPLPDLIRDLAGDVRKRAERHNDAFLGVIAGGLGTVAGRVEKQIAALQAEVAELERSLGVPT